MSRHPLPAGLRFSILERDNFTCQYCGRKAPDVELHVDHYVPVAAGGSNDPSNLVTACADCNLGKSDLSVSPLMAELRNGHPWYILEELADHWQGLTGLAPTFRGVRVLAWLLEQHDPATVEIAIDRAVSLADTEDIASVEEAFSGLGLIFKEIEAE